MRGFRSGLEEKCAAQIEAAGLTVHFEEDKLAYEWPSRKSTYTPDFKLPSKNGGIFYVESKGRFLTADRQKHLLIKEQLPDIEVRFVFSNSNAKLYRGSKTSYAMWCIKHGFQFAHKTIPDDWLQEGANCDDAERQNPHTPA
tara:strand:+ start:159 stop:584 length:426 start_codon:yes stop_codon:yes gene_type:complete